MTAEVLAAVAGVAREVAAVGMGWVLAAARGVEGLNSLVKSKHSRVINGIPEGYRVGATLRDKHDKGVASVTALRALSALALAAWDL